MEAVFIKIIQNKVVVVPVLAWFLAQVFKFTIESVKTGKVDFYRFVGLGGMPSSHSSYICSLATIVGLLHGFDSALFGITLALAIVVMVDAAGIRRAAGRQALFLNRLMDIHSKSEEIESIDDEKLKEQLGHSPLEVIMGAFFGIVVAGLYFYFSR